MIDRRIREERHARGLTQQRLAQLADVPRSQLQKLERGDNVTLSTIQKTIGQLTGLRLDVVPQDLDVAEVRRTASEVERILRELLAATHALIRATGAPLDPRSPESAQDTAAQAAAPGAGGATLHEAGVDSKLLDRLTNELDEAQSAHTADEDH